MEQHLLSSSPASPGGDYAVNDAGARVQRERVRRNMVLTVDQRQSRSGETRAIGLRTCRLHPPLLTSLPASSVAISCLSSHVPNCPPMILSVHCQAYHSFHQLEI